MKDIRTLAIAATISIAAASSAWACHCDAKTTSTSKAKSVVSLAASSDQFETLVAAIKAADLVSVLESDGPFTVFAPTDEAFAKLPAGTVETLLKPENKDQLIAILKYHVVPGKVLAKDVKTMKAPTAQGQKINIKVESEGVFVNNARVIKTDLMANNGVVHVIDTVILPQS
jgi:uncharacterized surface protein with fasciclin (FAS1) repeats